MYPSIIFFLTMRSPFTLLQSRTDLCGKGLKGGKHATKVLVVDGRVAVVGVKHEPGDTRLFIFADIIHDLFRRPHQQRPRLRRIAVCDDP